MSSSEHIKSSWQCVESSLEHVKSSWGHVKSSEEPQGSYPECFVSLYLILAGIQLQRSQMTAGWVGGWLGGRFLLRLKISRADQYINPNL